MKITLLQMDVCYKNKQKNINKLRRMLGAATEIGDMVLLPEMFLTGYLFNDPYEIHELSEVISDSDTMTELQRLASEFDTLLVAGIAEKVGDTYFNSTIVVSSGGLQTHYRKISQTNIDKRYFSRGHDLAIFSLAGITFGVVICFDIWFPEIVREYTKRGVDVLLHPANFGGRQSHVIARARAIENNVWVATCNRIGNEKITDMEVSYCGGSRVIDGVGNIIGAVEQQETLITCDIAIGTPKAKTVIGVELADEIFKINTCLSKAL